ncbi:MAG: hypothetical protein H6551_07245 [Chitinophagales bacterium]|nr:hypothetical protein [Chitinophagales bacterium]
MKRFVKILIPRELSQNSLRERLLGINSQYAENDKFIQRASSFLKMLYVKQMTIADSYDDGYVPLMANITARFLGNNVKRQPHYYKTYIDTLIQCSLLDVKKSYQIGTNSIKGKSKEYKVLLSNENDKVIDQLEKKILLSNNIVHNIDHQANIAKLSIDEEKYVFINCLLSPSKRKQGINILDHISIGTYFVKEDQNGRVHSIITRLPKELRCAFTIDDMQIYEVDIKSCQPFVFLRTIHQELNYRKKKRRTLEEWGEVHPDIGMYLSDTTSGKIYENIHRRLKKLKKTEPCDPDELKETKLKVLANVFFADIPSSIRGVTRHFNDLYPTVFDILCNLKQKYGYKYISKILQQTESEIMIEAINSLDTAISRIRLHDCILCTKDNVETVKGVILSTAFNAIRVMPTVSSGLWGLEFRQLIEEYTSWGKEMSDLFVMLEINKENRDKVRKSVFKKTDLLEEQKGGVYYAKLNELFDPTKEEAVERERNTLYFPHHWKKANYQSFNNFYEREINSIFNGKLNDTEGWNKEYLMSIKQSWLDYFHYKN